MIEAGSEICKFHYYYLYRPIASPNIPGVAGATPGPFAF
jgi:hypothetical protein